MKTPDEAERAEVFREHFMECLAHFTARFNANYQPGKRGLAEARQPIADFCGVTAHTISRWLSATGAEQTSPVGDVEIRMKCFLDLNGYRIIEFERLPKVVRNFAELIGFSVLPPEEAAQLVGYNRAQEIYRIVREVVDETSIGQDKRSRMWEVWKSKRDELERKKREATKLCRFEFLIQNTAPKPMQPLLLPPPVSETKDTTSTRRTAVLAILEGSLALFEEGLFDELSEGELADLKEYHGGVILRLSARLSNLSSRLITGRRGD